MSGGRPGPPIKGMYGSIGMDIFVMSASDWNGGRKIESEARYLPFGESFWGMIPYYAIREENGVPFFLKCDVDLFGKPDLWGLDEYFVIETREDLEMVLGKEGERDGPRSRPVHLYSRFERFKGVLMELLGVKEVPKEVIELLKERCFDPHRDRCWNSVRKILKQEGLTRYYNRIPTMLQMLGMEKNLHCEYEVVMEILNDFKRISARFDGALWGRTYFPNLRFCALKYLELAGVEFEYKIPFLRTPRKLREMNIVWDLLLG